MKKKKIVLTASIIVATIAVIGGGFWVISKNAKAGIESGLALTRQYYPDAEYIGKIGEKENVILEYQSGNWTVQTDEKGERVLSIGLSPDGAKEAESNLGETLDENEIESIAKEELKKYVDIDYTIRTQIDLMDPYYRITMRETKGGRETGAGGIMYYYMDGQLFAMNFTARSLENPDSEEIISEEEAFQLACEAIMNDRDDLVLDTEFENANRIELMTVEGKMIYDIHVNAPEKIGVEYNVVGVVILDAVTGDVLEDIAYTDR